VSLILTFFANDSHFERSTGRDPLRSIQLIHDLSLYSSIFSIPEKITSTFSSTPGSPVTSVAAATLLQALLKPVSSTSSFAALPSIHKTLISSALSPGTKSRLFLAAALTPYRGITYTDSKKKQHLAVEAAIREGLKLGTQNHYLDGIPALFIAADLFKDPTSNDRLKSPSERVAIGQWFHLFLMLFC
jgi:tRNA nucleotidyltransferase (CCA-adding enzyme)